MVIHPIIDLTRVAWSQRHGDLIAYGTWRYDADDHQYVPCLVIVAAWRRCQPCIVTLDLAWIWSEEAGDPVFAAVTAASFCQSLGLSVTPKNGMRIASIIRDHLEDLIKRIPPYAGDKVEVAVARLMDERGKVREVGVADHV